ncbi:hypothetical protein COCNU_06G013070 [Cocos nucifera]|uniref:Uncharacterized protein n=1 Tax=Cocos nucifera TaxID=13894 RepID=A0A8K0IBX6_COCNU|nr:hypothetical protein COCNU_06G013070 [Cocos nucifera]
MEAIALLFPFGITRMSQKKDPMVIRDTGMEDEDPDICGSKDGGIYATCGDDICGIYSDGICRICGDGVYRISGTSDAPCQDALLFGSQSIAINVSTHDLSISHSIWVRSSSSIIARA